MTGWSNMFRSPWFNPVLFYSLQSYLWRFWLFNSEKVFPTILGYIAANYARSMEDPERSLNQKLHPALTFFLICYNDVDLLVKLCKLFEKHTFSTKIGITWNYKTSRNNIQKNPLLYAKLRLQVVYCWKCKNILMRC